MHYLMFGLNSKIFSSSYSNEQIESLYVYINTGSKHLYFLMLTLRDVINDANTVYVKSQNRFSLFLSTLPVGLAFVFLLSLVVFFFWPEQVFFRREDARPHHWHGTWSMPNEWPANWIQQVNLFHHHFKLNAVSSGHAIKMCVLSFSKANELIN